MYLHLTKQFRNRELNLNGDLKLIIVTQLYKEGKLPFCDSTV